jgi:hypothetical protein
MVLQIAGNPGTTPVERHKRVYRYGSGETPSLKSLIDSIVNLDTITPVFITQATITIST